MTLMRLFLAFVGLLALEACYLSHGPPEAEPDAEPPPPPPPPPPPVLDAATPDTGMPPTCAVGLPGEARRVDALCLPEGATPFTPIPAALLLNTSHCSGQLLCDVAVHEDSRILSITTFYCASADACIEPPPLVDRSSCTLPPLAPGSWHVDVNGTSGFDLEVDDGLGPFEPPPTCWTLAEEPPVPEDACEWPGSIGVDRACLPAELAFGRSGVAVLTHDCGCGNPAGPCSVSFREGRVDVSLRFRDCGSRCRDTCEPAMRECWLPPDLPVGRYEVFVDGVRGSARVQVRETVSTEPPSICLP